MKLVLISALLIPSAAFAADPFVIFAADAAYTDPGVTPLISKYLSPRDYLGLDAIVHLKSVSRAVVGDRSVVMGTSIFDLDKGLARAQSQSQKPVVFYQEFEGKNPADEHAHLIATFQTAADMVHSRRASFGILPGGKFFGYTGGCSYDIDSAEWRSLDWTRIDYLSIQGDALINNKCVGKSSEKDYAAMVSAISEYVRAKNPAIVITAQISFRDTSPADMLKATNALAPLVDGFFFSYPLNPAMEHKYSNAQSLEEVLSVLRRPQ